MSMKQESAISPVGTVEYMAPEVGSIQTRLEWSIRGKPKALPSAVMQNLPPTQQAVQQADAAPIPPFVVDAAAPCALPLLSSQVVALPPVDKVISGEIKATDIPPTNEKVDIWALGVTIYELVTGGPSGRGGLA